MYMVLYIKIWYVYDWRVHELKNTWESGQGPCLGDGTAALSRGTRAAGGTWESVNMSPRRAGRRRKGKERWEEHGSEGLVLCH